MALPACWSYGSSFGPIYLTRGPHQKTAIHYDETAPASSFTPQIASGDAVSACASLTPRCQSCLLQAGHPLFLFLLNRDLGNPSCKRRTLDTSINLEAAVCGVSTRENGEATNSSELRLVANMSGQTDCSAGDFELTVPNLQSEFHMQ